MARIRWLKFFGAIFQFHFLQLWLALGFFLGDVLQSAIFILKSTPLQFVARTLVLWGDVLWRGIFEFPASNLWIDFGFDGWHTMLNSAICGLHFGLVWVTFFGASFNFIPSNLWLALWFCWVNVLWSDFESHPLHFCGSNFGFGGICLLGRVSIPKTCNFVSRTLILMRGVILLILERFRIPSPPIWGSHFGFVGWISEFRIAILKLPLFLLVFREWIENVWRMLLHTREFWAYGERCACVFAEVDLLSFFWFNFCVETGACCSNVMEIRCVDISIPFCMLSHGLVSTEILDRMLEQLPEFYRVFSLQYREGRFLRRTECWRVECNPPPSNLNLSTIFLFGREKWLAIGGFNVLKCWTVNS